MHIVLYHFVQPVLFAQSPSRRLPPILGFGFLSVGLFFSLSGFVLAYNYLGREFRATDFFKARFARIYPLYALAFALVVPIVIEQWRTHDSHLAFACGGPCSATKLLAAFVLTPLMLQSWTPVTANTFNPPGWSLSTEAFFYLVFPFLLAPISRIRAPRRLVALLAAVWAAGMIVPVVFVWRIALTPQGAALLGGYAWTNPIAHLPTFVAGMAAGCLYSRVYASRWVLRWKWLGDVMVIAAAVALVVLLGLPSAGRWVLAIHTGGLIPIWACLVLGLSFGGAIARALAHRWMIFLGNASYAIYILQNPLSSYYRWTASHLLGKPFFRDFTTWPSFAGYVAMLIAASAVSYVYFETPLRKKLVKRSSAARMSRRAQPERA